MERDPGDNPNTAQSNQCNYCGINLDSRITFRFGFHFAVTVTVTNANSDVYAIDLV